MSFVYFNYSRNLNYAFLFWALDITYRIIMYLKSDLFQIFKKDSVNEYYFVILQNISFLFSGFLVLYINYSFKRKYNNKESKIIPNKLEIQLISEERLLKFYLTKKYIYKIILASVINYLNRLAFFIFYQLNPGAKHNNIFHQVQYNIIDNIDIITRFFLSTIVFKIKEYKHHILSFIIIIIGFIILIPVDFYLIHYNETEIDEKLTYIYTCILSYRGILFPLEDTIAKQVFTDNYILPEYYFFFRALCEFLLILVVTPALYFSLWINDKGAFNLASNLTNMIIIFLIYCFFYFLEEYIILKVIYFFSVQSIAFLLVSESATDSIIEIINFFIEKKSNSNGYEITLLLINIIIILLMVFATFIYNEIIVIKVCGLDKNVASEIIARSLKEINQINIFEQEDEFVSEESSEYEDATTKIELEEKNK